LGDGLEQLRCLVALSLDGPVNTFYLAELITASPDVWREREMGAYARCLAFGQIPGHEPLKINS